MKGKTLPNKFVKKQSHNRFIELSSFSFAKTFYARTKPVAQFIKYLNCGEDIPGILDDRKKRLSFLP